MNNSPNQKIAYQISGLTKTYTTGEIEVRALRGVDLAIRQGEMIVMLGPSGSGKSTFLNLIGGLDTPTDGQILFEGKELTGQDDRFLTQYRRHYAGFVFQFYNLIPSLNARENVALVSEIVSDPMPVDEALEMVGLKARADHFPSQLSGGEQQRVAVARALVKKPRVLLCDEPTGALDSATGIKVLDALAGVNETLGTTTIIITHNASIAAIGDRVLYFADGRIAKEERNEKRQPASALMW
ncbi:ABC transporter ATP-binding protein [Photobacterium galatheae]|uniref:ABC transporter n=1 Tax=Photobacterium galatheae TaxID=1654360 RepID=A0A066RHS6_9GAMM|nr:ABC transporter ATP-binding protein [Photobacterium galatheae]KDM89874.1 ABC transporter [Photobacterium galatheae]MCM0151169.1 ABC transporter ATP-binding protein [Photobacterium galatheae]